jgi:hypothetical protein
MGDPSLKFQNLNGITLSPVEACAEKLTKNEDATEMVDPKEIDLLEQRKYSVIISSL